MNFIKTSDGSNLIQGFKRANNILVQAEQNVGVEYSYGADLKYAKEDAQRDLFSALDIEEAKIRKESLASGFMKMNIWPPASIKVRGLYYGLLTLDAIHLTK